MYIITGKGQITQSDKYFEHDRKIYRVEICAKFQDNVFNFYLYRFFLKIFNIILNMYISPCQRHKTPGTQNTCFSVFSLIYIDFQDFNMILRMYITTGQRHKD